MKGRQRHYQHASRAELNWGRRGLNYSYIVISSDLYNATKKIADNFLSYCKHTKTKVKHKLLHKTPSVKAFMHASKISNVLYDITSINYYIMCTS